MLEIGSDDFKNYENNEFCQKRRLIPGVLPTENEREYDMSSFNRKSSVGEGNSKIGTVLMRTVTGKGCSCRILKLYSKTNDRIEYRMCIV